MNKKVPTYITTVYESDEEILQAIIQLYCPSGFDVDVTFSTGGFYKNGVIPRPPLCFDIEPQAYGVIQADCRDLSFWIPNPDSIGSMVIDLPFIHAHGKDSIIGNRFFSFKSQNDLRECYAAAAVEAYRILSKGGILIWKCQNIIESGNQNWNHTWLINHCWLCGFDLEDEFVLHRTKLPLIGHNHHQQKHARKTHAYWLVLRKAEKIHNLRCKIEIPY